MIVGLKLQMPAADLEEHLGSRQQYHTAQAKLYDGRLDALKGVPADSGVSNDPVTTLRAKREEHQQKAAFFGLLAQYIVHGETYQLDVSDIQRLEFVSRWF